MRVMVTGANGFVGRTLVHRLLDEGQLRGQSISRLILLDQDLQDFGDDSRLRCHCGSITDTALLRRVLADGIDVLFHLVSIPGGAAEAQYSLGYQVNLLASLELLELMRCMATVPILVYASSIAVYGGNLPSRMNESAALRSELSYGAHKSMIETAINDLSRRGEVDGRSIRLPGIVARPRQSNGLRSAFMSDLLQAYAAGDLYCCPVSAQATSWWMSVRCCVDNLLQAATINCTELEGARVWQLPLLQLSIEQVLEALGKTYGAQRRDLISFKPDPQLEALFGNFPPMKTPQARALGFRHDGSAVSLIRNSLNPQSRPRRNASTKASVQEFFAHD